MKTFNLNKKSWHFWLATRFGVMDKYEKDTNFCRYFWSTVLGGFVFSMLTAVVGVATYFVGWIVYSWYQFFATGFTMNEGVKVTLIIGALAAIAYALKLLFAFLEKRRRAKREAYYAIERAKEEGTYVEPEPGFLKQAYRSWKEKTCYKVAFN